MSTPMSLMYANVALEVNHTFNYTSKYIIMGQELNGIICTFPSGVCCILWQMFSMFCKSPHFWYIFPHLLHVVLTSPPPHMTLSTWWYYSRLSCPWQPITSKTEDFALAPGPTPLALVTDRRDHLHVTTTHPLRYIASVRVPTTQPRTPQDLTQMITATCDQPHCQPCLPRLVPQHSPSEELAIITSLYLVPFHLCTLLFSFSVCHCPIPAVP